MAVNKLRQERERAKRLESTLWVLDQIAHGISAAESLNECSKDYKAMARVRKMVIQYRDSYIKVKRHG